jgi:hypothetical protein
MGNAGVTMGSGRKGIALGDGMVVARWTAQCCWSIRLNNFFVLQTCFFFANVSHPPLTVATYLVFHS